VGLEYADRADLFSDPKFLLYVFEARVVEVAGWLDFLGFAPPG
jgi:hypothetical protein